MTTFVEVRDLWSSNEAGSKGRTAMGTRSNEVRQERSFVVARSTVLGAKATESSKHAANRRRQLAHAITEQERNQISMQLAKPLLTAYNSASAESEMSSVINSQ